jgi:hypothetical protein
MNKEAIIGMCEKFIHRIILRRFPMITEFEILEPVKLAGLENNYQSPIRLIFVFWMTNKDEEILDSLKSEIKIMLNGFGLKSIIPYFEFLSDRE